MKRLIYLFILIGFFGYSQDEISDSKPRFIQFELSCPLKGNPDRGKTDIYGNAQNNSWFVPDGIGAKIGYGVQQKKWIGLSAHTGIEWKAEAKLVAVPVFANLRLSFKVGDETRLTLQSGFGRGFALGRGNLNGQYRRLNIGFENNEDVILFAELSEYAFKVNKFQSVYSLNFGIALRSF
jgi:hypothetical protein